MDKNKIINTLKFLNECPNPSDEYRKMHRDFTSWFDHFIDESNMLDRNSAIKRGCTLAIESLTRDTMSDAEKMKVFSDFFHAGVESLLGEIDPREEKQRKYLEVLYAVFLNGAVAQSKLQISSDVLQTAEANAGGRVLMNMN